MLEADTGEDNLRRIEDATGVRPLRCPWRSTMDPFVAACSRVLRPYRLGHPIENAALLTGVEILNGAIETIGVHDMRADRVEREKKSKGEKSAPATVVKRRKR